MQERSLHSNVTDLEVTSSHIIGHKRSIDLLWVTHLPSVDTRWKLLLFHPRKLASVSLPPDPVTPLTPRTTKVASVKSCPRGTAPWSYLEQNIWHLRKENSHIMTPRTRSRTISLGVPSKSSHALSLVALHSSPLHRGQGPQVWQGRTRLLAVWWCRPDCCGGRWWTQGREINKEREREKKGEKGRKRERKGEKEREREGTGKRGRQRKRNPWLLL